VRFVALGSCLLAVFVGGCPGDDAMPADSGVMGDVAVDGGVDAGYVLFPIDPPAPPAAPSLPIFTPCPEGFAPTVLEHGIDACEPLPSDDGATCPPGQARFVGESGCQPIGAACPAGPFAADSPSPALYVDPSAAPSGDGSRASPFRTAAEAFAAATAGTTVMLSRGDHPPLGLVPSGVTVRGACVAETRIVCPGSGGGVDIDGEVTVRDVTVTGCQSGVYIRPDSAASYHLESIVFSDTHGIALNIFSGDGTGRSLVFRDGVREADADGTGWGLGANLGPRFTATRVTIESMVEHGVLVSGEGTDVTLEDLLIRDMASAGMGRAKGGCATVNFSASLTLRRALLDGCKRTGASASSATLVLEDVVARRIGVQESDGAFGMALLAREGATVTARRVRLEDADVGGAWAIDEGTVVRLDDIVVRGSDGQPDMRTSALGVESSGGSTITGARVAVWDVDGYGLFVQSPMTSLVLEDVLVRDLRGTTSEAQAGQGGAAFDHGALTLTRAHIENVHISGVSAIKDAVASLTDILVTNVKTQSGTDVGGCGVCTLAGGALTIERGEVSDVMGSGVGGTPGRGVLPPELLGEGDGSLRLIDVEVRGVRTSMDGSNSGIFVNGTPLDLERVRVTDVDGVGIGAIGEGAPFSIRHADVSDVGPSIEGQFGYGITIEEGASGAIADVRISRARGVGAFLSSGATTIERLAVVDVVPDDSQGVARGINAQSGARVTLTEGIVAGAGDIGIFVTGAGTEIDANGLAVYDTGAVACAACAVVGMGMGAYGAGHIVATDFLVTRSALAGVHLAGGEMDLSEGEVSYSPIGANVSTPGFELTRIQDRVVYRDNETNLDSTELPVPAAPSAPDLMQGGGL